MQRWEYMTWYTPKPGAPGSTVSTIDGKRMGEERPSLYEALAAAGDEGWELVGVSPGNVLFFKRLKAEG
jgi:hypothetical protein